MAYGFQVLTTNGYEDVLDFKVAQLLYKEVINTASGTRSLPNFSTSVGFIFTLTPNFGTIITWNNTTKALSWSGFSGTATIYFFRRA